MSKALFLDRDGTLIIDKHYLKDANDVELIPGVDHFLNQAKSAGYLLFMFTNQSGISRGYHTIEDTKRCNQKMLELLNLPKDYFTEICIAPELPTDLQVYRKPSPRFILEMIDKYNLDPKLCWMVGDHFSDLKAGINAGINTAWVQTGKPRSDDINDYIQLHSIPVLSQLSDLLALKV
jgi:D-glycero-D-manno-heptose 1,7-bisphosphate phosphatase